MSKEIQSIVVGVGESSDFFKVGKNGVTKITYSSTEWSDVGGVDREFDVWKGEQLTHKIINQPVTIYYKESPDVSSKD